MLRAVLRAVLRRIRVTCVRCVQRADDASASPALPLSVSPAVALALRVTRRAVRRSCGACRACGAGGGHQCCLLIAAAGGRWPPAGVVHIMFQTDCTKADASTGGICAGGKVGAHAFAHLASTDGGAHFRRLTDALIPTPGSPYDGFDGDCDGTVSFPQGIGPVILWGADCGTGKWPPKPPGPPPARARRDYPRVAVAMAANATDPLLLGWRKTRQNPVVWSDPTQPCSFPGRVWRSDPNATVSVPRAVQFHPHGGQLDFVWLAARTPHGGASYVW